MTNLLSQILISILKRTLLGLLSLIVILSIGIICIINFVDPNQFKIQIGKFLVEHTHQHVDFKGPIRWSLYPLLAIEADNIEFKAPKHLYKPNLKIKSITAQAKLSALLFGKFIPNYISCDNLELSFPNAINLPQDNNTDQKNPLLLILSLFEIKNLKVNNAHISLTMPKNNWEIEKLNILSHKEMLTSQNTFIINGQVSSIDTHFHNYFNLDTRLNINLNDEELNITNGTLTVTDGTIPDIMLKANMSIKNLTTPNIKGHLDVKTDDFNKISVLSDFNLDLNLNDYFAMTGLIQEEIKNNHLKANYQSQVNVNRGFIKIPITVDFAHSIQNVSFTLDTKTKPYSMAFLHHGDNFDISTVLQTLGYKKFLSGLTRFNISLTAKGDNIDAIFKSLEGHSELQIRNGDIYGIDLEKLLTSLQNTLGLIVDAFKNKGNPSGFGSLAETAMSEWNAQSHAANDSDHSPLKTNFRELRTTAFIKNKILVTPDITLMHPEYKISGHGQTDLSSKAISYNFDAYLFKPDTAAPQIGEFIKNTPLQIEITGTTLSPVIRPLMQNYLKEAFKFSQKNAINLLKDNILKQIIPNEKTNNQTEEKILKSLGFDGLFEK